MIPLKTCIDHHHICQAACCKMVRFKLSSRQWLHKGQTAVFTMTNGVNPDLKWYYELHGFKVEGDKVIVLLDDFRQEANTVIINAKCSQLQDNFLCGIHHTGKPIVCSQSSWDNPRPKNEYIQPNCMFKQKPMEEKQ